MNQLSVSKESLVRRIEVGLIEEMNDCEYLVERASPELFVTSNRLDIGFRLLYLELIGSYSTLAEEIYYHDIRAQSLGTLVDPDNSNKNSFDKFKEVFKSIVHSIKREGFDSSKTLIPVSLSGSILNGGHRLSACLYTGEDVWIVRTGLPSISCDYNYFYNRSVPVFIIEMAVLKILEFAKNTHIAFLWPSGKENWSITEQLFTNEIYKKDIDLTFRGAFNLLYLCYRHMDWVGNENNNFAGIQQKRLECFPQSLTVRMIIYQEPAGIIQTQKLKNKIREINGVGFSSIHITDTKEEIESISSFVLNCNGLHFLNNTTESFFRPKPRLEEIKAKIESLHIDENNFIIDGSYVLELYGMRNAADIDIMFDDSIKLSGLGFLDNHDSELKYHALNKKALLYDPRYHFKYNGLKIVSLRQLVEFKRRRSEKKDLLDNMMAESYINNYFWQKIFVRFQQGCVYSKLRFNKILSNAIRFILNKLHLYESVRAFWLRINGIVKKS